MIILAAAVSPDAFSVLEKILLIISIVEGLGIVPLIYYLLRIRDTINNVEELKQESEDNIQHYNREIHKLAAEVNKWKGELEEERKQEAKKLNEEFKAINKQMMENTIQFTEIFGKLNTTLAQLDSSVKALTQTVKREAQTTDSAVQRVYDSFAELKKDVQRELDNLKK